MLYLYYSRAFFSYLYQTYRINVFSADISWGCSYRNMWCKFIGVCGGRVMHCSIKKTISSMQLHCSLFYRGKDKDKEYLLAQRDLSCTWQLSCAGRYCAAPDNHACTSLNSTHTITKCTNGTIKQYMKTLSIPTHFPSVLNFKLLQGYPSTDVHVLL